MRAAGARLKPSARSRMSRMRRLAIVAAILASTMLAACAPRAPEPPERPEKGVTSPAMRVERGRISHYGYEFAGRTTASGQVFDPQALTMAHRTLAFGTRVRVTNLENQRTVEVVVNDRGPAVPGRIADLSLGAARRLGMVDEGVVEAMLEVLAKGR